MDQYAKAIGEGIGGVIGELGEGVIIAVLALKQQPEFDATSFDKTINECLRQAEAAGKKTTVSFLKQLL